jgi:hypothetical protein
MPQYSEIQKKKKKKINNIDSHNFSLNHYHVMKIYWNP